VLHRAARGLAIVHFPPDFSAAPLAAYDRMMINLPTSTGNEHTLRTAATSFQHGKLNAAGLHTHYNQDGYGDSELICYAICPLWDMNRETGATAIVPGAADSIMISEGIISPCSFSSFKSYKFHKP
jgi:ectoine hydroxylase-related dioxygenase (phytanoyl-CoA dioxygenase family)